MPIRRSTSACRCSSSRGAGRRARPPELAGAHCSLDSLELAVGLARSGSAAAVVTGPVAKEQLYAIGFPHPGQTEFVAERCGVSSGNVVMMLAGPTLRTVPVTTHLPLSEVPRTLTSALIESRGRAALRGLQRNFGIAEPRLAIAGLNPHSGEGGTLGREEIEIIEPAIAALAAEGWRVSGPHPADTMFHAARARQLRRRPVHVPRPGADPAQGAPFRRCRQHHARPADRPHRARSRHRVRHRRPGPRRPPPDGRRDPHGGAPRGAAEPPRREPSHAGTAARNHRPPRAEREQGARPELHPRPPFARADRRDPRPARGQTGLRSRPRPRRPDPRPARCRRQGLAVERDRRCIPALAELHPVWRRLDADRRRRPQIDERGACRRRPHVVANLPYNVGTALLSLARRRVAAVVALADPDVPEGGRRADRRLARERRLRTPVGRGAVALACRGSR